MIVWRSLFLLSLVFTLVFFFNNVSNLVVDTSLRDLSPDLNIDNSTQKAMDDLTADISRSILFVIGAKDQQQLNQSKAELSSSLSTLKPLTVLSADSIRVADIIDSLSKYRFQLLNKEQRETLKSKTNTELAKQAQIKLFRLTNANLLSFENDPLGVHSEYFSEFLKKISVDVNQSKVIPSKANPSDKKYYQVIQTKLTKSGLGIDAQNALLLNINKISNQLKDKYDIEILRSGIFFFAVDAAEKSKKDISFISAVSMVGVFLVLLLTFRSVIPLILPFLSIAFGVAFAVAVSHFIYGKIHILTIVFGASLIGIVIDYSIHYFFHNSSCDSSLQYLNNESKKKLHSALLLSLITSLLGYLALYFSQLDALKKVAIFSCCGLTMAWLSVICLGQYANTKAAASNKVIDTILNILKKPLLILTPSMLVVIVVCLLVGLTFSIFNLEKSDDPRFFFTADKSILASEVAVSKIASDYEPGRFVIIKGDSSESLFDNTIAFYNQLKVGSSEQNLSATTLSGNNFKSITQWLPSLKQQNENYSNLSHIYKDDGAVDSLYELLGANKSDANIIKTEYANASGLILQADLMNKLFADVLPPLWSGEKNNFRNFILIAKGTDFKALEKLTDKLPNAHYFNSVEQAQKSLADQRISASKLLIVAYVLILLLIIIRYRKLSALKILLVPMCATAMLIIIFALLNIPFNLFHVMALFLVLGLGMDYGIFAYELQDGNVTQQAILISAVTSLLSFGLLGLSSIPVAQSFGTILFLGNSFNLIASLIYADTLAINTAKKQQKSWRV